MLQVHKNVGHITKRNTSGALYKVFVEHIKRDATILRHTGHICTYKPVLFTQIYHLWV